MPAIKVFKKKSNFLANEKAASKNLKAAFIFLYIKPVIEQIAIHDILELAVFRYQQ